ncbi:30S ribosomal protein S16 [bacterium]|nr:30S ribosomal protein S16 [bacterium]
MAVRMRLTRMGRKKRPFYRIVVADVREPRDGKYLECIGTYCPISDPVEVKIVDERAVYWLSQGAQPTDTVKNLLQRQGIIIKRHLQQKGLDENQIEDEMKKWEVLQIDRKRRAEVKVAKAGNTPAPAPVEPEAEVDTPAEASETSEA